MAKLFGVDIKAILDKHVATGLYDAKITRLSEGTRDPGDPTGGLVRDPADHPCKGIWVDYENNEVDGTLVLAGDRKALIMKVDLVPQAEDVITIFDAGRNAQTSLTAVRLVGSDPAGSTFTIQCRDRTAASA
jgi:hypothetical protein